MDGYKACLSANANAVNSLTHVDDEVNRFVLLGAIADHSVNGEQLTKDDNVIMTKSGGKRHKETTKGSCNKKIKQITSKDRSKYLQRTHRFGVTMPKSVKEARVLNTTNGGTLWRFAVCKEGNYMDGNIRRKIIVGRGKSLKFLLI